MADEESTMSSVASTTTVDSHKRKLEDLELNEGNLDLDSVNNAAQCEENCGAVEFEPKRPRFESNVSQDGHQEEEKEDEMKGKESEHPKDDNGQAVAGQEPVKEQLETITEESASDGNEDPEIGSAKELGPKNLEGKEPSEARPRQGDVPVLAPEQHPGSDAQIQSRIIEVPNDKLGVLIGKAGDNIRSLQDNSGAKIQMVNDADADLRSATTPLELVGPLHNINKAEKLIKDVIAEHMMEEERQTQGSGVGPILPQSSSGYSQGSQTSKETSSAQHAACAEQIQMLKAELKELTEVIRRLVPNIQLPPYV